MSSMRPPLFWVQGIAQTPQCARRGGGLAERAGDKCASEPAGLRKCVPRGLVAGCVHSGGIVEGRHVPGAVVRRAVTDLSPRRIPAHFLAAPSLASHNW